jgi:glycosyltransferase involved in cell wall biosynthesis
LREAAIGLADRGWEIEVLTTCAINHFTWANDLPEGVTEEDGLLVRRFPTVYTPSRGARRAARAVEQGESPTFNEQLSWLSYRFRVPGLFHHLLRYGHEYRAVVFSPYLFWTTVVCFPVVADRAVVIPCLHDEPFAHLAVFRRVLSDPASVWFLSEPEHQLAHRLGSVAASHAVTGSGVHVPTSYDPEGFRVRHGLHRPFVLYAGRREPLKGWDWLLRTYAELVTRGDIDLDLVTIGVGPVEPPAAVAGRVIDLGCVDSVERDNAFSAAQAYIQPSRMESFSRTTMEAWLASTVVLTIEESEVVAWHCKRSGGGRTFADKNELEQCLRWLLEARDEAEAMAERGRRYVLTEYTWPVVLDRMEANLKGMGWSQQHPA